MAYKEVGGHKSYPKFKETEPGSVLVEGVYHREIESRYGKQFEFENDDGSIIVLNAAGQLKYKMDFVREGDRVKIIYVGEEILQNGAMKGRPAHQFTVLRDDDGTEPEDTSDQGLDEFDDDLEDDL